MVEVYRGRSGFEHLVCVLTDEELRPVGLASCRWSLSNIATASWLHESFVNPFGSLCLASGLT